MDFNSAQNKFEDNTFQFTTEEQDRGDFLNKVSMKKTSDFIEKNWGGAHDEVGLPGTSREVQFPSVGAQFQDKGGPSVF